MLGPYSFTMLRLGCLVPIPSLRYDKDAWSLFLHYATIRMLVPIPSLCYDKDAWSLFLHYATIRMLGPYSFTMLR